MAGNVLITGAAGYIGGTIVATLAKEQANVPLKKNQVFAAVRGKAQADSFANFGVNVLQLDLANEKDVMNSILHNGINTVIHCASSINSALALNLIDALEKQKEASGAEVYFVHTSASSAFFPNTGWPAGELKDTEGIFEVEKQLENSYPVRKTDVEVVEHANIKGVTSFVVVPSLVYGEGSGPWNRLSIVIPPSINAITKSRKVFKFPEDPLLASVHVTDVTNLYVLLLQKILDKEDIPNGTKGYYFAIADNLTWWGILEHLAVALHARGLVQDTTLSPWESNAAAAQALGVPEPFVVPLWNSGMNIIAQNAFNIGWKPQWNRDRFYENINDEIDAVLEHGKAKSSFMDSLFEFAKMG